MIFRFPARPAPSEYQKIAPVLVAKDGPRMRCGTEVKILFPPLLDGTANRLPEFLLKNLVAPVILYHKMNPAADIRGKKASVIRMVKHGNDPVFLRMLPDRAVQAQPETNNPQRIKQARKRNCTKGFFN